MALSLVVGGAFAFIAALGIVRLPDVFTRMHASAKAATLGTGLVFAGVAIHFGDTTSVSFCLLAIIFVFVTGPVAAHAIGRAAYRTGVPLWEKTRLDELGEHGEGVPTGTAGD